MVKTVTSLTQNGLRDWLLQRITAVVLASYILFLTIYLSMHCPLHYLEWQALFANGYMRVFTFLTLLSLVYHTWVGLWTVFTDYIKCPYLRLTLHFIVVAALLGY